MGGHSISGFLIIYEVCYLIFCLRLRKDKKSFMSIVIYVSLCLLFILGVAGVFYRALEATNYIIGGIIEMGILSNDHDDEGESQYYNAWAASIICLIVGILKLLNSL